MSLAELADFALPASQRPPQAQPRPRPTNGLWTSRIPVLLPPSPIPGQYGVPISSHSSLPLFPRYWFGLYASKSGDLYFYGGETKGRADELYCYSMKDNTITPLQCWGDSPGVRFWHTMTMLGDVIALHGGAHGSNKELADPGLYLLNLDMNA